MTKTSHSESPVEEDSDIDTDDEMKVDHDYTKAAGRQLEDVTFQRKNAKTDIFPEEQGKANLKGAKTTNVKSEHRKLEANKLVILLLFAFVICQNFHIYRCAEWDSDDKLAPSRFCRDEEAYELFFEDDRDVPNKLMVHCVGNSKHIIKCQSISLRAKCLMVGEAVNDKMLELPPLTIGTDPHLFLFWNTREQTDVILHEKYHENQRQQCNQKYQRFQNEENAAVYEIGVGITHSVGIQIDKWSTTCTGWVWLHFNGKTEGIMDKEDEYTQEAQAHKEKVVKAAMAMRAVKEIYRQSPDLVRRAQRDSYRVVPKDKTKNDIFWNFIGWIGTVPCSRRECHNQSRVLCGCSMENDALSQFVHQMIRVIVTEPGSFLFQMLLNLLQVPKWGKSFDDAQEHDLYQLTLKQAVQLISQRHFQGEIKGEHSRYLKQWISMEFYNFECWHCGSTNKSVMIDRIYRYSYNMVYCRTCSRIQPGRRKQSAEKQIVLNIDSIPTRYDQQDDVPEDEETIFRCGNLVRYTVHSPKFKSFAEELLLNDIFHLNPSQWFQCLERAKKWLRENQPTVQQQRTSFSDVKFGIFRGDNIDIRHIVALYFFNDFPDYAAAFIKSYHMAPEEHCKSFYWMGRFLWEMNHFFGTTLTTEKELYSVIGKNSMFDSFAPSVFVPLQTVDDDDDLDYNESTSRILSFRPKYTKIDDVQIDDTKYIETNKWTTRNDDSEWYVLCPYSFQLSVAKCV